LFCSKGGNKSGRSRRRLTAKAVLQKSAVADGNIINSKKRKHFSWLGLLGIKTSLENTMKKGRITMKRIRKMMALVIAVVMMVAMANVAMAATITITHDESYEDAGGTARVYNAYKIFDASYTTLSGENTQDDKDGFTYTPDDAPVSYSLATDSPWVSVFMSGDTQVAATAAWVDVKMAADGSKYIVTPKSTYTTAEQAAAFAAYLEERVPSTATATEVTVDGGAATVDGNGYYLIVAKDTKDAVTKLALVTTDVTIVEKNTYITTGKTTSETSYNVGDTVTYTATVDIPSDTALTETEGTGYKAGHGPIILHDTMDSALTFDGTTSITATMDSAAFTAFTSAADELDDDCTFEITIPVTSAVLGKTITFTYTAKVNSTAATDTGFVNELFGENNGYKTTPDDVHVYTFDFDFSKEFTDGDSSLTATFEVRTDADDASTAIAFLEKEDGKQEKAGSGETGDTTITITNGETIDLVGLKAGTYYLVETSTSTGYNLLDEAITVTITDTTEDPENPSHTVTYSGAGISGTGTIPVVNNHGSVLPSTGGIGTTIFYVIGAILVLGAGILLVTRRRMNAN